MEKITLIAWLILFPLATTIEKWFSIKIGEMIKRENKEPVAQCVAIIQLLVFVAVALYLFQQPTGN